MIRQRRIRPVETTTDLKQVIEQALSFIPEKERKEAVKKSCQRSFQALRIDVNSEFEVLYDFLESCLRCWLQTEERQSLPSIQERIVW